jgi:hypothetical protein
MVDTPNKGYNLQAVGSNVNVWGLVVNDIFSDIDTNLAGKLTKTLVAGTTTLTADEAKNVFHVLNGALTGEVVYEFPANVGGFFFFSNDTTGPYTITVKPVGGTGYVLPSSPARVGVRIDVATNTAYALLNTPDEPIPLSDLQFTSDESYEFSYPEDISNVTFIQPVYGQSGAKGVNSNDADVALTTSAVYPGYALCPYTAATDPNPARSPAGATIIGFTDLREYAGEVGQPSLRETPNSGIVNRFIFEVHRARGVYPRVVVVNGAEGSKNYRQLKRGSTVYRAFIKNMKEVIDLIKAENRTPIILPIAYVQGTADTTGPQITDQWMFAENDIRLQRDLEEDFKALSGQVIQIPLVVLQTRSFNSTLSAKAPYLRLNPTNVPSMGEQIVSQIGSRVILGGQIYDLPTYPNPGLHPTSIGYRMMGFRLGHIIANVFLGGEWSALRWMENETHWVNDRTIQLAYRVPQVYVPSASYTGGTGGVASDILTVSAVASGQVVIGQRITGTGIPAGTVIFGPVDSTSNGGAGDYYLSQTITIANGTAITATSTIGPPDYYTGDIFFDDSGTIVGTDGITTSKGFKFVDTGHRYVDRPVPIEKVEVYRIEKAPSEEPVLGLYRFVRITLAYRPTGAGLLSYATEPYQFYSVDDIDIVAGGSGGTNGTYALGFSGGTFEVAAQGTFTVSGGAVTSISMTEVNGITGGLYQSTSALPAVSFAACPGLTGAVGIPNFGTTAADGNEWGPRGSLRDNLAAVVTTGTSSGQVCYNWALHQAQWLPPPPFTARNLIGNGQGLVYTRQQGLWLTTGDYGHDGWFAQVQGSGAGARLIASTVYDDHGHPYIKLTTNVLAADPARRFAYCWPVPTTDVVNARDTTLTLGGQVSRSDATSETNALVIMALVGWTGAAGAMPATFINQWTSTCFEPTSSFTGAIANGTLLTVSAMGVGSPPVVVGQELAGAGVTAGCMIERQVSGTPGGVGVYEFSPSHANVAAVAMTGESFYISDNSLVHLAPEDIEAQFTKCAAGGVITIGYPATALIPDNVTQIVAFVVPLDGMKNEAVVGGGYMRVAMKLEQGNFSSGFPLQSRTDASYAFGSKAVADVRDWGAYCDVQLVTNSGSCTAGSRTVPTGVHVVPSWAVGLPVVLPTSGAAPFFPQNDVVVAGGGTSGNAIGDRITLTGGTFSSAAVLTVSAVNGGGQITAVRWASRADYGSYTVIPSNPVSQGSTSGGGVGTPTFTLTWSGQPLVTTIESVSSTNVAGVQTNTMTLAAGGAAPGVTQSTLPVFYYGHDDKAAIQRCIDDQVAGGGEAVLISGLCGVSDTINMPVGVVNSTATGQPAMRVPMVIGYGQRLSGLISLASMAKLARRATGSTFGGGAQNLTFNGMCLTTGNMFNVEGGSGAYYLNCKFLNATGANACFRDENANSICVDACDFRTDTFFSGGMVPDYNLYANCEVGRYSHVKAVSAGIANVVAAGGNGYFLSTHTFSSGGTAPPTYGVLISNNAFMVNTQVDGANTANIQVNAPANLVNGHLDNGNGALPKTSGGYGIDIADGIAATISNFTVGASWDGPADNIIHQSGTISPFTQVFGNSGANLVRLNIQLKLPQGRLTLSSTKPVMDADVTSQKQVYYLPYTGALLPSFNISTAGHRKSYMNYRTLSTSGITFDLDSDAGHTAHQVANQLYDVFAFVDGANVLKIGTGPTWGGGAPSLTSRGTGAGTPELVREANSGLWVNAQSMTVRFGEAAGNTTTVGVNMGVYLGTLYITATGRILATFNAAAAAGGNDSKLTVYNAYNKVPFIGKSRDSSAQWSYDTNTWRAANNSNSNRISWVDGLADVFVDTRHSIMIDATGANALTGVNFDSTSAAPGEISASQNADPVTVQAGASTVPLLGFHYAQAMENGGGGTALWGNGSGYQSLTWRGWL